MILECKLTFEAAHRNTSAQADQRTRRLHGHSYEATIAVKGELDQTIGWVMDFAEVKDRARTVIDRLDHYTLNEIAGMRDTTRKDVERWASESLRPILPALHDCRIAIIGEHQWSPALKRIPSGGERLIFGFDAAHFLPALPETHKCRRIHGHSFRVAVSSPDAGKLADPLFDIYTMLDHRLLNEVPGLENPTSERLAQWIDQELKGRKCGYTEIRVAETCTSSCRLNRE